MPKKLWNKSLKNNNQIKIRIMEKYETGKTNNKIYASFNLSNVIELFPLRTFLQLEYKLIGDLYLHKTTITSSKDSKINIPKTLIGTESYHKKGTVVIESHIGYADEDNLEDLLKLLQFNYKISGGSQGDITYDSYDKLIPIQSERGNKVILLKIIDLI
ncbi:hypothetical protein A0O34_19195 [Chryseobacterium glaciei]|uniref:Uncharacterized protein n=2 Tax=Chryseobacterium glaciei TaxID=1685010 RepID=A0A172Y081_9FLAO|nr:hypothetical protein A0O34_19195 [Chryseobacterium glaciei]